MLSIGLGEFDLVTWAIDLVKKSIETSGAVK